MESIIAKTKVQIFGTKNSWSLTPQPGMSASGKLNNISLEIQGDAKNGYHLVMSPEGFFTADYWYESKDDAIQNALELFGVAANEWEKT